MTFLLSNTSLRRRSGVNKKLIEISDLALTISIIDFGIPDHGGLRTRDEQYQLYKDGLSKCDGHSKESKHQSGNAIDVYAYVDGAASWEIEHLSMVAAAMLQAANILGYKLKWGGLWRKFRDMPHFELMGD